jgi:hypothetical protein
MVGCLHQRPENHLLRIYELAREACTSRTFPLPPSTAWPHLALYEPRFGHQATRGDHSAEQRLQTGSESLKLARSGLGAFLISVTRQAGALVYGVRCYFRRSDGRSGVPRGLPQTKRWDSGRRRPGHHHRGAPPDGHQWVPAPWFPPHTSRGGWGTGCGGSGRRFGAPSGPFHCLGASGVVWIATEIR